MTTTDTSAPAQRNYPLPAPESDPRFTFGLLYEVAKTIEAHGYPPLTSRDVVALMEALFGVLYAPYSVPDLADELVHAYPPIDHPSDRSDPQPRCGASGRVALFAADVTCPTCLALMAGQNTDAEGDADASDDAAIEHGAQIDAAVEATGHLPGHHDADGADQAWFWSEDWQAGEREAHAQIEAGDLPVYDEMTALFADISDADGAPDELAAERALDAYLAAYPTTGEDWGA